jgi:hypothetical protein
MRSMSLVRARVALHQARDPLLEPSDASLDQVETLVHCRNLSAEASVEHLDARVEHDHDRVAQGGDVFGAQRPRHAEKCAVIQRGAQRVAPGRCLRWPPVGIRQGAGPELQTTSGNIVRCALNTHAARSPARRFSRLSSQPLPPANDTSGP